MIAVRKICFIVGFLLPVLVQSQVREKLIFWTDKDNYHVGESIWFTIHVREASSLAALPVSKVAYLELLNRNDSVVLQAKINLDSAKGNGRFFIPSALTPGIYTVRAYTNWMKNFDPADFAYQDINIINVLQSKTAPISFKKDILPAEDLPVTLSADKHRYITREKVVLDISDSSQNITDASIAVFKLYSPFSREKFSAIPIKNEGHVEPIFLPEVYGHIMTGKIINKKSGEPVPGIDGYMSVIGAVNMFYAARSDSSGRLVFEVNNVYDENKAVLQTIDSNYTIVLDKSFSSQYSHRKNSVDTVSIDRIDWLTDAAVSAQVQMLYNNDQRRALIPYDTMRFYGFPEYSYVVDEYVRFSTLEEIFREYIRPVQMFRRDKIIVPYIFYDKERRLFDNKPFVLIDNVPVFNMKQFMDLNTARIERIDICDRPYYFQQQTFDGIISITTKTRYPEDYLSRQTAVEDFPGLQSPQIFSFPVYDTNEQRKSRLPDFRNVLCWIPSFNIKEKKQVSFYTSDLPGDYAILMKGIDKNGEVAGKMIIFKVE